MDLERARRWDVLKVDLDRMIDEWGVTVVLSALADLMARRADHVYEKDVQVAEQYNKSAELIHHAVSSIQPVESWPSLQH